MYLKITPLCISVGCWPLVDQTKAIFFYGTTPTWWVGHIPEFICLSTCTRCHDNSKGRRIWRVVFWGFFWEIFLPGRNFQIQFCFEERMLFFLSSTNFFFILSLIHLTSSTQEVICCTWYDLKAFQLHLTIR